MHPHPDEALPYGVVGPKDWGEGITVIVATGPSLGNRDLDALKADTRLSHFVAVKEAAWAMPWADAAVCLDHKWPARRDLTLLRCPLFLCPGEGYAGPIPQGATFLRRATSGWLSEHPGSLVMGATSGYGALGYAYLRGARRIILLGYDYRHGRDGQHHARAEWNSWYPPANERLWSYWRDPFREAAAILRAKGVAVINASPGTALDAFPVHPFECAVAYLSGMGPPGDSSVSGGKGKPPAPRFRIRGRAAPRYG